MSPWGGQRDRVKMREQEREKGKDRADGESERDIRRESD